MRLMGPEALVPRSETSKAAPGNKVYPYLLRGVTITAQPDGGWRLAGAAAGDYTLSVR